jgi:hypothetical protein
MVTEIIICPKCLVVSLKDSFFSVLAEKSEIRSLFNFGRRIVRFSVFARIKINQNPNPWWQGCTQPILSIDENPKALC